MVNSATPGHQSDPHRLCGKYGLLHPRGLAGGRLGMEWWGDGSKSRIFHKVWQYRCYIYIYILLDIYILCGAVRIWANFEGLGMIDYDMPSWDVWDQIHVPSWDWNIYSEHTKDRLANLWSATGPCSQAGVFSEVNFRMSRKCDESAEMWLLHFASNSSPSMSVLTMAHPTVWVRVKTLEPWFFSQKLLANGYPSSSSHSNDPRLLEVFNGIHIPSKNPGRSRSMRCSPSVVISSAWSWAPRHDFCGWNHGTFAGGM